MLGEKKVIFCGVYDVQAALGGRSNVPGKLFSKTIKKTEIIQCTCRTILFNTDRTYSPKLFYQTLT